MIVEKIGKYILTNDFNHVISGIKSHTIPKGTIIEIDRIDSSCHQVFSQSIGDWVSDYLPVKECLMELKNKL